MVLHTSENSSVEHIRRLGGGGLLARRRGNTYKPTREKLRVSIWYLAQKRDRDPEISMHKHKVRTLPEAVLGTARHVPEVTAAARAGGLPANSLLAPLVCKSRAVMI
jgi:hypothetical protein